MLLGKLVSPPLAQLLRYNCMKRLLHIFLILFCIKANAQYLVSSNTSIESCNDIDGCLSVNSSSFLYYDETKGEFFLKVDFNDFRFRPDSIANWLNSERDTTFYFRMIFPKENIPALAVEERKTFKINGRIFYNNVWKDQPIELTMFSSTNSLMNNTSSNTNYAFESYKVNFTIPFVPIEFKSYKELYYNSQTVNINVTLGRINMLRPGMEPLLSEVYYQPNR